MNNSDSIRLNSQQRLEGALKMSNRHQSAEISRITGDVPQILVAHRSGLEWSGVFLHWIWSGVGLAWSGLGWDGILKHDLVWNGLV